MGPVREGDAGSRGDPRIVFYGNFVFAPSSQTVVRNCCSYRELRMDRSIGIT